ncbi:NAD-dependent epimerase/dehydratase family protein [Chthonobacter albigriseus]|uniref:NAD-dependent epimerase/dehydratase family protein n=1 Tax=Chthonobacter albigriseus TaxID=1683161 RepID=UPI0015EF94B0|nr:NAD-dependent epimerase/dehydratase family protein [Chthonobacter albigriseus]
MMALDREAGRVAIIGGAGFIGCNLAESFLCDGWRVTVIDTLARPGVEANLAWLIDRHGPMVEHRAVDVRDARGLAAALRDADAVFHFAAQVAVTTSLVDPVADFEVNAAGTLNVLEAVRALDRRVPVVFSSTNKVYGGLEDVLFASDGERWLPENEDLRTHGIPETRNLDFCTPYGCSKGVADQYVLDYAKSYDLPTAVLRMSCIYGPRQFGTEDQGWLAHFLIRALRGEAITIYGDGHQVRDVLHVADAVKAYRLVLDRIDAVAGQAFNLGGGPRNAVSLRQVLDDIGRRLDREPELHFDDWRKGDQVWFVADTRRLTQAAGWHASVHWREGLMDLARWLESWTAADALGLPVGDRPLDTRRVMA